MVPDAHHQQPVQSANKNVIGLTGIRDDRKSSGTKEESIEEVQRLEISDLQIKSSNYIKNFY